MKITALITRLKHFSWFHGDPVPRRTPDGVFIMGALMILGISQLITDIQPGSLQALVTPLAVFTWKLSLAWAGGLAFFGILMPPKESIYGLFMEMIGRAIISVTSLIYVAGLLAASGTRGFFPAGVVLGVALACGARAAQLAVYLRDYRKKVNQILALRSAGE